MSDPTTFEDLLRRVRGGDQGAAAELVRQYEPTIRRVARVRLLDSRLRRLLDSLDIAQSVFGSFFVRAALGEYDLKTPEQLLNLLVSMSSRKVIDQARRAKAARRDIRRDQGGEPDEQRWAAPGPSPSQEVAGAELLEAFRGRLSAEERQLAEDRAAGLDWPQIAAKRGDSPEALRKRLARAIDRISEELGLEGAG